MMTDAWDTEAELLTSAIGKSLDECRERVIFRWMEQGDLRPLRAALLRGWVMGRVVQQHLGAMLLDDNEEYCCIDNPTGRQTSHQLIVRQRGPGNPRKPENFVRDIDLVANMLILMKTGLSYEEAIAEVVSKTGWKEGTVKGAYQKYVTTINRDDCLDDDN
jgi:hypothetical protein